MKKTLAIAALTVLTVSGLTACDSGQCKAEGVQIERVSVVQKGGGGGGGGHAGGGGGHASGGEGASGGHVSEPVPGARPVPIFPFMGGGNGQCKGASK